MDEGEEGSAELVVAGGDAPVLLELVEEAFDMIALTIDGLLPAELLLPVGAVGNVGEGALGLDMRSHAIGVVALVGNHHGTLLQPIEQRFGTCYVVVVAGRDQEADRPALRIDPRVDLRGEPASASAHTTNSTVFFTPEAC